MAPLLKSTATAFLADQALLAGQLRKGAPNEPVGVLAVAGEIVAIGSRSELECEGDARGLNVTSEYRPGLLLPGTVNAHNHSFQSLLRGLADDRPFLDWRDQALYRYAPKLGAVGVEVGALFAFGEMLLAGVTTVCDFFYIQDGGGENALRVISAAEKLGMRSVMGRCFYDWDGAPVGFRETPHEAERRFFELVSATKQLPRATVLAAPHSLHGASPAMIETAYRAACDADTPMHIHLAEERYQVDDALSRFGKRPLWFVESLGVLTERTVAVHGCWFDESERELLAARGAGLAYNPASNMFLGDGVTDICDLHSRGVRIGLGTDGGCSNSRVSVFDEMRSCALLQKVARTDGGAISAETCFNFGTRGGASLLALPVGQLATAHRADLVWVDLEDPSLWPQHDIMKNVVYSMTQTAVRDVVVEGEWAVRDRKLVRIEMAEILEQVRQLTRTWEIAR